MRKLLLAVLALVPALAFGSTTWTSIGTRSVKAAYTTLTETAPSSVTTSPTEGAALNTTASCSVTAEADAGQTLSGAGSMVYYVWDSAFGGWSYLGSDSVTVTSYRRQTFALTVPGPRGRFLAIPSGVTVSSGALTGYITCTDPRGYAN